jgi:hypothetical protein
VPFWNASIDPQSRLESGSTSLKLGTDFVPSNIAARGRTLDGVPTIYGGPMNDTSRWIPFAQAAGKIVVFDLPPGVPLRGINVPPGRFRDASGFALAVLDGMGAEFVARLREGRPVPDSVRNPNAMPSIWITRRVASTLLGGDPTTLTPGATGGTLSGRFDIARTPVRFRARNVVGILRGSDPTLRGQYVSLTAHNDHVGFDHFPVDHDSLRAFNRVIRPMGADSPQRHDRRGVGEDPHHPRLACGACNAAPRLHPQRRRRRWLGHRRHPRNRRAMSRSHEAQALDPLRQPHRRGGRTARLQVVQRSRDGAHRFDRRRDRPGYDWTGHADGFSARWNGCGSATYLEVIGAKRLSTEFGDSLEAANSREPVPFVFDYTYDAPGHPLQYYCRADHYSYARMDPGVACHAASISTTTR